MSKRKRAKPEEELKKSLEPKPRKPILDGPPLRKDPLTADKLRLSDLRRLLCRDRDLLENAALEEYTEKYPIDLKSCREDVKSLKEGESLYVFSFCYAKIWSAKYKNFLLSLKGDNFSRIYIGFYRNKDLAGVLISKSKKELRPDLRPVSEVLGSTIDVGVLITNKSEDEIFKKFDGYQEFDFAKPGNIPMETLKHTKDHVLSLPSNRKAKILFGKLQGLGMPVELIDGQKIKLTKDYVVCEKSKCVTEKASKILSLSEDFLA